MLYTICARGCVCVCAPDAIDTMGNPGLTSLNVDHTRLGNDGGIALGSMLANNERNSIQHLRAAECQIEDLGALRVFAFAIQ